MKNILSILTIILVTFIFGIGCGKKGVDTSKVEQSFASSEPSTKATAQQAADAAKQGNYAAATASLQQLAVKAKLTPEQQAAVKDLLDQVQKQIKEQVAKAAESAKDSANKAAADFQKALGK